MEEASALQQAQRYPCASLIHRLWTARDGMYPGLGRRLVRLDGGNGSAHLALQVSGGHPPDVGPRRCPSADQVARGGVDGAQRLDGKLALAHVAAQVAYIRRRGEEHAA